MENDIFKGLMFSEPKYGWTKFNLSKYNEKLCINTDWEDVVRVSYLTRLPVHMFEMLIKAYENRYKLNIFTSFDAEGWEWELGVSDYNIEIRLPNLDYNNEGYVPYCYSFLLNINFIKFAEDWLKCYQTYKDKWISFSILHEDADIEEVGRQFGKEAKQQILDSKNKITQDLYFLEKELLKILDEYYQEHNLKNPYRDKIIDDYKTIE